MISISTNPEFVKSVFILQEKNEAGIYTVKFYIRGRPVLFNIDDIVVFERDVLQISEATDTKFTEISEDHPTFWPILLEKAYSKIQ